MKNLVEDVKNKFNEILLYTRKLRVKRKLWGGKKANRGWIVGVPERILPDISVIGVPERREKMERKYVNTLHQLPGGEGEGGFCCVLVFLVIFRT